MNELARMVVLGAPAKRRERAVVGQHLNLLKSFGEDMAVVRVAEQRLHADDEAFADSGGDTGPGAESMSRTRALPLEMQSTSGSLALAQFDCGLGGEGTSFFRAFS